MKRKIMLIFTALLFIFMAALPVAADDVNVESELVYEIIVDRFNNLDHSIDQQVNLEDPEAYHGGDLAGVTGNLDELVKLGVTTIVLSPIMENADGGYHGYWVEDFTSIEESFGTMDDLNVLVEAAHEREIKVILEFVTNYISESHPIALDEEKADWILPGQAEGPVWTERAVRLNQDHPEVREMLQEAASFWLEETDIDGLMLHAADQASADFLEVFTAELKAAHEDTYLFGDILLDREGIEEIWERTAFDAIDNYPLSEAVAEVFSSPDQSAEDIYELSKEAERIPSLIFVDDKYSQRFTTMFSENGRNTLTAWKLALTYLYATPGTPVILQGTEVGMHGTTVEETQRLVPFTSGDPDLKEFHGRISNLRSEFPALTYGDFELVDSNGHMSVFKRTYEDQTMYIAINNGTESSYIDLTDVEADKMLRGYLEDNLARANEEGNYRIGIPRESAEIYQLMDDVGYNWTLIGFAAVVISLFVFMMLYLQHKQKKREQGSQK